MSDISDDVMNIRDAVKYDPEAPEMNVTLDALLAVLAAAIPVRDALMHDHHSVNAVETFNLDDAINAVQPGQDSPKLSGRNP